MNEMLLILSSVFLTLGVVCLYHVKSLYNTCLKLSETFHRQTKDLSDLHNTVAQEHAMLRKDLSDLQLVQGLKKRGE